MGFHEVRFPEKIELGVTGGPGYSTTIVTTISGIERRNANWQQSRGRWDVSSGIKDRDDLGALIEFFRARQGKAYGFRFKDWSDFEAVETTIGTGDGTTVAFQLVKEYTSGSTEVTRTITKPVADTVDVYLDGMLQASGFTVDTTTGIVTFGTAPSTDVVVSAAFEFDVPVRFDVDEMSLTQSAFFYGDWSQIPIVEIKT